MTSDRPMRVGGGVQQVAAEPNEYVGEIKRANADGTQIVGFLVDKLGARIELRGHKDPRRHHGYFLYGTVTIPEWLKQPIDDELERGS